MKGLNIERMHKEKRTNDSRNGVPSEQHTCIQLKMDPMGPGNDRQIMIIHVWTTLCVQ